MPSFSEHSLRELETCHAGLQLLAFTAINFFDFKVLEGHRGEEAQNAYVESGHSQVRWPNSKHNKSPSMAFDFVPWPIDWRPERFYYFGGRFTEIARIIGIEIRWGGDWDRDTQVLDQNFMDLGHIELFPS